MCDECDIVPVRYVAYFNKAGGKYWRPAQKPAPAWAIDIRPAETAAAVEANGFACEGAGRDSVGVVGQRSDISDEATVSPVDREII